MDPLDRVAEAEQTFQRTKARFESEIAAAQEVRDRVLREAVNDSGLSLRAIAAVTNMTFQRVHQLVKGAPAYETAPVSELREARRGRIAEMYRTGRSVREIAAELGSTEKSINVEIKRMRDSGMDLPLRKPRRRSPEL